MKGLIKTISKSTTKTGSLYARVGLITIEKEQPVNITVNIWEYDEKYPYKEGQILKFISPIKVDGDFRSTKSSNVLVQTVEECPEFQQFIHVLPTFEEWNKEIQVALSYFKYKVLAKYLTDSHESLFKLYSKYPAAKSNHHAWAGGLMEHVYQMIKLANAIRSTNVLPFIHDHVILGILFHDYGKIKEYLDGELTEQFFLKGHIFISASFIERHMSSLGISQEHIDRITHIILAHHGLKEYGSPVVPATIEAFVVNHIDLLSGHGDIYTQASHMESSRALGTTIINNPSKRFITMNIGIIAPMENEFNNIKEAYECNQNTPQVLLYLLWYR